MQLVFFLFLSLLVSCASKNDLSKKYRIRGRVSVIINGQDATKSCSLIINKKEGLTFGVNEIKFHKEPGVEFSSDDQTININSLTCSPGYIASTIKYKFGVNDIRIDTNSLQDLNFGKLEFNWNTGSYISAIGNSVLQSVVLGSSNSMSRSTTSFIAKHDQKDQKNTTVVISEKLQKSL
jgi:hypothetical protein